MQNKSVDALIASVKQMVNYCQEVHHLLMNDENHFQKQDLSSLDQSNKKKEELLDKLNSLTSGFAQDGLMSQAGGLLDNIEHTDIDVNKKQELRQIIADLKAEISNCYEYVISNTHIISANLQFIQSIRQGLLSFTTEMESVYDNTGNKVK